MTKEMEERLAKANDLREQEKYGESAREYTECLLECVKANDLEGLIHSLGGLSLIYKHQIRKSKLPVYKNLTIAFAQEGYKVAEENKENLDGKILAVAYRCWGDALIMSGRLEEALPVFEEAFKVTTADICEKGYLKSHIAEIKYLLGEKEAGIQMAKEALVDIRTGNMNEYTPRVWETGCLIKLAIAYALEGKKEVAMEYIVEAEQIAKENNLSIRLKESEEIREKIEQGRTDFSL